jgi:hypothetical protein
MLPSFMLEIRYYISGERSPFAELEAVARAKVTTAIARIEQRNLSNVKSVGEGVLDIESILVPATGFTSGATAAHW